MRRERRKGRREGGRGRKDELEESEILDVIRVIESVDPFSEPIKGNTEPKPTQSANLKQTNEMLERNETHVSVFSSSSLNAS